MPVAGDAPTGAGRQGAPIAGHRPLVPTSPIRHAGSARRDVDGVPIHRGPDVSARARDLSARAYTEDGEIHLPSEAGPLDEEPARSLLAHELVHAHQQRQLRDRLPDEATEEGRRLEAEAERAERGVRVGAAAGQPGGAAGRAGHAAGRAAHAAAREPLHLAPRRQPSFDTSRATIPAAVLDGGLTEGRDDGSIVSTAAETRPAAHEPSHPGANPRPLHPAPRAPQRAPQRADQDVADPLEAQGRASARESGEGGQGGDAAEPGESDGDDVGLLIKKLYPQMLDRLRRDLVIERERAGRLIDRR